MSSRSTTSSEEQLLDLYWREIRDHAPLSRQQELELFTRLRNGDDSARRPLVEANLRFVMRVANDYVRAEGPSILELVAEGNVGLMKAIDHFDENKGFKFITYAVWWIRQAIHKCLAEDRRSIRTPMNRLEDLRTLEKGADALSQKAGRNVSYQDAAEQSGMRAPRTGNA
ncbi:MAG: sigma-70 family RNA polymerase sigma factor, partial [Gemmatimonadetes bacterium]|nr:sigma-70 family RNA polymerase sigma factor [Gemmatimonadota bacterium]